MANLVRMKIQDANDFIEYLEDSLIENDEITFEDDDYIIVSKDLADILENDGVAYKVINFNS